MSSWGDLSACRRHAVQHCTFYLWPLYYSYSRCLERVGRVSSLVSFFGDSKMMEGIDVLFWGKPKRNAVNARMNFSGVLKVRWGRKSLRYWTDHDQGNSKQVIRSSVDRTGASQQEGPWFVSGSGHLSVRYCIMNWNHITYGSEFRGGRQQKLKYLLTAPLFLCRPRQCFTVLLSSTKMTPRLPFPWFHVA